LKLNKPLVIGRIGSPYGVQGWLKVTSYTDPPENILSYQPWYINFKGQWQELPVNQTQLRHKDILIQIDGYADRDQARIFTGIEIVIERNQLPSLSEDEYYWADLEGLTVITIQGQILGTVSELFSTGSNDVLVVKGEKKRLIPYLTDVILKVDLINKTIQVDWDPEF